MYTFYFACMSISLSLRKIYKQDLEIETKYDWKRVNTSFKIEKKNDFVLNYINLNNTKVNRATEKRLLRVCGKRPFSLNQIIFCENWKLRKLI